MRLNLRITYLKNFLLALVAVHGLLACNNLEAQTVLFTEDWETPVITTPGVELAGIFFPVDRSLPPGWTDVDRASLIYLLNQSQRSLFTGSGPFAAPANGNQALVISRGRSSDGVSFASETIAADTEYTFSSAIGSSLTDSETNDNWRLQLWADTSENGAVSSGDVLLGELNGGQAAALNPDRGEFVLNSLAINSNDTPDLIGTTLLLSLSLTQGGGTAYFDNVSLTSAPATGIPEPNTALAIMLIGSGLTLIRRR